MTNFLTHNLTTDKQANKQTALKSRESERNWKMPSAVELQNLQPKDFRLHFPRRNLKSPTTENPKLDQPGNKSRQQKNIKTTTTGLRVAEFFFFLRTKIKL
jgi:hypothetical protein